MLYPLRMYTHILDPDRVFAIISHDAGAANVIISWLEDSTETNFKLYFQGPAMRLLPERFLALQSPSLDDCIKGVDTVLTGTGWASTLEVDAIRVAHEQGLKVISLIDHWTNYRERFFRNNRLTLPSEIWVTDQYALDIAQKHFLTTPIFTRPNTYLERQISEVARFCEEIPFQLLYVGSGGNAHLELESLSYVVYNLDKLQIPLSTKIQIRPHPSEDKSMYAHWIKEVALPVNIEIDHKSHLSEAIGRAHWVVGRETLPLVVALANNKRVLSALTPEMGKLRLPQKGIKQIRELLMLGQPANA